MPTYKGAIKWTVIIILGVVFATCVSLSFLLTEDKMTLALISVVLVVAVIFTVMGTVMMTCFFLEIKNIPNNNCDVELRHRLHAAHMTFRQQSAPITLHPPAPRLVAGDCPFRLPQVHGPPSYEESADLENNRVQTYSNAPPAYNHLNMEVSNNIASFSPPPFYRPTTPVQPTSMQTVSLYLSPEQPSTSRTLYDTSPTRVLSPLPRRKLRRTRPHICPAVSYNISSRVENMPHSTNQDDVIATTSSPIIDASAPGPSSPKHTSSTSSVTHMIIDCSKAEPTMFTISRDESII